MTISAQAANSWKPEKQVTIIMPSAPGTVSDVIWLPLRRALEGQGIKVIADYKLGADGIVAANYFKTLPADGHNLMLMSSNQHSLPFAFNKDIVKYSMDDFDYVTMIARVPFAISAKNPQSVNTMLNKLREKKLNVGMPSQLNGLIWDNIQSLGNIPAANINRVNYKIQTEVSRDLINEQLDYGSGSLPLALQFYKTDRIAIVAITGTRRSPLLPDVPTLNETLPGAVVVFDFSLIVPKGTSAGAIKFWVDTVRTSNEAANTKEYYGNQSITGYTGDELGPEFQKKFTSQIRNNLLSRIRN